MAPGRRDKRGREETQENDARNVRQRTVEDNPLAQGDDNSADEAPGDNIPTVENAPNGNVQLPEVYVEAPTNTNNNRPQRLLSYEEATGITTKGIFQRWIASGKLILNLRNL
jgi:hypothetical protein